MSSPVKYSYTLWSPSDTVRDVAESLGIVNLPEDVAKALAMDIEYRINEVLEQATKFMRHSKRTNLTTADISHAFKALNVEPLYGYDSSRPVRMREAILGPGQTLYYIDDDEVDFEKIINMPLPKVPREVSFTAHWLAIEGVQPAIPQNPLPAESRTSMAAGSGSTPAEVEVKPLVKHALSKELQLYFERVVAILTEDSSNATMKNAVLNSLANDPGLHQLIPYFIQFVAEKIRLNLKDASMLYLMLEVLHRLLTNPTIFIEPYIHSVMPPILTLLVGKRLGSSQSSNEEHYKVRDFAASLLQQVCTQYGDTYHTLKPRVTRTLLKAFMDSSKSIGTQYGALSGLRAIGQEVVRVLVLGNLKDWAVVISSASSVTEEDKSRLGKAVLEALRSLVDPEFATIDEISDADKEKFTEYVGPEVASLVFEVEDSEAIVKAVLDSQKFS
ncbi:hypothetical protein V1525DRAFT_408899 [Lipomyces kononenkoae]|uniref:Uncharacterized protein n=1 Tax=Lipomyces kononenkoae TaxID=34357 RepID=A0ACC3SVV3_LIPKO